MKKIIYTVLLSVPFCLALTAQTVSTAKVVFANCKTTYQTIAQQIHPADLPYTFMGETFVQSDFTNNYAERVIRTTTDEGCDRIITIQVTLLVD